MSSSRVFSSVRTLSTSKLYCASILLNGIVAILFALPVHAQSDEDLDTPSAEVPAVDSDVKTIRGLADDEQAGQACGTKQCGPSLKLDLKVMGFLNSPLEKSYVSSRFGLRMHPIYNELRFHAGVDLVAPIGTPVRATLGGKVAFVGANGGYGNTVVIEHSAGYATRYAHLQKFADRIRAGRIVDKGEIIAYLGETGKVTGPHLHYEIRYRDAAVNPLTGQGATGIGQIQKTGFGKSGRSQKLRSGRIRTIIR